MEENQNIDELDVVEEEDEKAEEKRKKHAKGLFISIIITFILVIACFITLLVLK